MEARIIQARPVIQVLQPNQVPGLRRAPVVEYTHPHNGRVLVDGKFWQLHRVTALLLLVQLRFTNGSLTCTRYTYE